VAKLRAAVLAAGRGVRMGGKRPKTLIPVGNHEPLIYYILVGLVKAEVKDVIIVTGFKPAEVKGYVVEHVGELELSFHRNARYASWGNFHSLRMAIDQSPGHDLLVVNSDVIVRPELYRRVARAEGDLVLAVQKRLELDREDMRVQLHGDRVQAIGKHIDMAAGHGEFLGVSLLRRRAAALYAGICSDLEWTGETSIY
jgi:choline kinase